MFGIKNDKPSSLAVWISNFCAVNQSDWPRFRGGKGDHCEGVCVNIWYSCLPSANYAHIHTIFLSITHYTLCFCLLLYIYRYAYLWFIHIFFFSILIDLYIRFYWGSNGRQTCSIELIKYIIIIPLLLRPLLLIIIIIIIIHEYVYFRFRSCYRMFGAINARGYLMQMI